MTDNFILDIAAGIGTLLILHMLVWSIFKINKENQTPIYHNDNNIDIDQEVIYQPSDDYMDKLEYSLFDIRKTSPIPRHARSYKSAERNQPSPASSASFEDLKKQGKI